MVSIHDFGWELVYGNTSTIADSGVVSGAVADGVILSGCFLVRFLVGLLG